MKLTFLGTRGYIEERSRRHRMHASCMVSYYGTRVMIDCGEDWLDKFEKLKPSAIFITHAHPDHAFGLKNGAPCPVYATEETLDRMSGFSIAEKKPLRAHRSVCIGKMALKPFTVEHSTRAPAVGYRISAGRAAVFYVPDVVYIHKREDALKDIDCYIGDGAALEKSLVRKPKDHLIGHAPVRTQLTWCEKHGVGEAVITHCGARIVGGDERRIGARLRKMAAKRNVRATIAHDGMARTWR